MSEEKTMTLDDYIEKIIKPMYAKCAEQEAELLIQYREDLKFYGWTPPTRKQKFKWWIEDKKQRVKDIWKILKGGDIHDDCGNY